MKKFVIALLLVATIALSVGQLAFASTHCEHKICELAKANEKVTDAKCVIYERTAVVAIKTEQFTTKSDYQKFVKELVEKVKEECEVDHVFVTRNPKVMKQIEELSNLNEQQRDEAIQKLIEEVMRRKPNHKIRIPKKTVVEM